MYRTKLLYNEFFTQKFTQSFYTFLSHWFDIISSKVTFSIIKIFFDS